MAVDTESTTNETGQGGWESPPQPPAEPISVGTSCASLGKRHRYKGGPVCIKCGISKEDARKEARPERSATPVSTRTSTGAFETIASVLWLGLGVGVEYQPFVLNQNVKREDGTDVEGKPVKAPVGKSMQMTSAIAGRRIDKAFHKANPNIYKLVDAWLKKTGWATDLAPLFIPPLVVGIMATQPKIVSKFKDQLMMAMLPVMIEQAKVAQQQAKLMETLEDVNQETIDAAMGMVEDMLGVD